MSFKNQVFAKKDIEESSTGEEKNTGRLCKDDLCKKIGVKENPAACIFVASLNKNVPDEDLTTTVSSHFKQWGNVLGVKVLKDRLKRPYAFVQFELESDSKIALKEAPGTILNGRSIRCEPARVNRSICLISLNYLFNKQLIQSQFSTFGEIEDITILQPQGRINHAFIKFMYRDDAIKAYLELKNSDNHIDPWCVEWASNVDVNNIYSGIPSQYMARSLDRYGIFIGNLHESTLDADLSDKFGMYGTIATMQVIRKPTNYHKRVFAFIRYNEEDAPLNAISHENGETWNGKIIRVRYREYNYTPYAYAMNGQYLNKQQANSIPMMMIPYYNTNGYGPYYMSMVPTEQSSFSHNMAPSGTFYCRNNDM